jgi:hypothetical protein
LGLTLQSPNLEPLGIQKFLFQPLTLLFGFQSFFFLALTGLGFRSLRLLSFSA